MKFEFRQIGPTEIEVWYTSSKECAKLGMIKTTDCDGDDRPDMANLLMIALSQSQNSLLVPVCDRKWKEVENERG